MDWRIGFVYGSCPCRPSARLRGHTAGLPTDKLRCTLTKSHLVGGVLAPPSARTLCCRAGKARGIGL